MERTHVRVAGVLAGALLLAACGSEVQLPLAHSGTPDGTDLVAASSRSQTHGRPLTAVVGQGTGMVNVTTIAADHGTFRVQIAVNVHGTSPNTTFAVRRAVDMSPDGTCTNPAFLQFPLPNPDPLVTLTTSEGGAGAVHIDFARPIPSGTRFDVRFQVEAPGTDLRTDCFTVLVK